MQPKSSAFLAVCLMVASLLLSACGGGTSQLTTESDGSQQSATSASGTAPEQKPATSGELPKTVTISTHAVGGAYHATGSGVAALISEHTPIRGIVQPSAGPNAYMSDLDAGNSQFAVLASVDTAWAYTGGPGYDKPYKNLRLVLGGNQLQNNGWVVRKDANIMRIEDLEGQRIASDFGANLFLQRLGEAELKSVGLSWDAVTTVPAPDFSTGLRILRDGTVVATMAGSPTTPAAVEADKAVGVYVLPFGNLKPEDIKDGVPAKYQAILDELVPGTGLTVVKGGTGIVKEDTVLMAYRLLMISNTHTSADAVYTTLKAIWEHYEELHPVHPWLRGWNQELMPLVDTPIPYHEGAIKFYKEVGVWTDEHQAVHDKLLSE